MVDDLGNPEGMWSSLNQGNGDGKKPLPQYNRGKFSWLMIALMVLIILTVINISSQQGAEEISYSPEFPDYIDKGYVKSIEIGPTKIVGEFNAKGEEVRGTKKFQVRYNDLMEEHGLIERLQKANVEISAVKEDMWVPILWNLLPIAILFGMICFFAIRKVRSGSGVGEEN